MDKHRLLKFGLGHTHTVGNPYMTEEPWLPWETEQCPPHGFDSVWALPSDLDEGLNYGEQVTYSESTCIPSYLIVYSFKHMDDG